MKRPDYRKFTSPGKYIKAVVKYCQQDKDYPRTHELAVMLGYSGRSSIYHLYNDDAFIRIADLDLYRKTFKLTKIEAEYLAYLSLLKMANTTLERRVWRQKIRQFLKNNN